MLHSWFPSWLFEHYSFEQDDRQPDFFLRIPSAGIIGITNLSLIFWLDTFLLLSLQSVLNILVALVVYKFIVLPKQQNQQQFQAYLVGYGVIIPVLLFTPFYILYWLQLKNVTLMVCIVGALPNLLLLRVMEAMVSPTSKTVRVYCFQHKLLTCVIQNSTILYRPLPRKVSVALFYTTPEHCKS
jgi:hypothetical protein